VLHAKGTHLWVAGEKALMHFDGTKLRKFVPISCQPFVGVAGMAAVGDDLWVFRSTGISRIDSWSQYSGGSGDARVTCKTYSAFDGLNGSPQDRRPALVRGTDDRLWIATGNGISWIDPLRIVPDPLAPLLTIKAVAYDDTYHHPVQGMELPPGTTDVQIRYAAWSMTVPERVLFRYRLDGLSKDWRITSGERRAQYTNLDPGHYRFQLQAANEDRVWNEAGATIHFVILPRFYQTWWFRGLCALAFVVLLLVLIRLQVRSANARLRARLEERMRERERIARELHDTLLQGLQGLILPFQSVAARIPAQEPSRAMMEQVLERADDVMIESRDRVKDLRSFHGGSGDLAQDIAATGRDLLIDARTRIRVAVHGTLRGLHPIVCEEAFLVAREALTNAVRHAKANEIEVDVFYDRAALRVVIRDDGRGIDPLILRAGGREGHWGLLGIRERAKKIHAHMNIWSRVSAGTEVELRVPAALAYRTPIRRGRWFPIPYPWPVAAARELESTKES
jgi:signal transduction histidine kinase